MDRSLRCQRFLLLASVLTVATFGCGGGADPPFEELPLRDALTASPEVIAALSLDARQDLAKRLEDARATELDLWPASGSANPTPAGAVRALDALRELRGKDALVVAELDREDKRVAWQPLPGAMHREAGFELPALERPLPSTTTMTEDDALEGTAGVVVGELVRSAGATRVVRVTEWPAGAVAIDGVVYVNASWLIALSSLDPHDAKPARVGAPPVLPPTAVGGNPYLTYGSLEACTRDVTDRCEACLTSGGCDARPTLSDFASGEAECRFLGEAPERPRQLCALALLSIETVSACMKAGAPSCSLPSTESTGADLPSAASFLDNDVCVRALDTCLAGDNPSGGDGTIDVDLHVSTDGCQSPFTACASAFSTIDRSCKSRSCTGTSNQSCTSCSSCKRSDGGKTCGTGGSTGSSGSGSSSTGTASTTGAGGASGSSTSGSGSSTSGGAGSSVGSSGSGSSGSGSSGSGSSGSGSSGSGGSSGSCNNGSCSSCNNSSCGKCGGCGGSSGSGSSCKCETEASPVEPLASAAWLLAPLIYVSRRSRRRS